MKCKNMYDNLSLIHKRLELIESDGIEKHKDELLYICDLIVKIKIGQSDDLLKFSEKEDNIYKDCFLKTTCLYNLLKSQTI